MTEERTFIYKVLPDEIQAFFLDSGLEDIDRIGEKYGLSTAAMEELDIIQQELLFGYESLDSIDNLIRVRLGLEAPLARKVSLDMLRTRFLPIDSYMGSRSFRTYSNLGGDISVAKVKRIDATGGTVTDIRKANDHALSDAKVRKAQEQAMEITGEVTPEPTVFSKQDDDDFDAEMDALFSEEVASPAMPAKPIAKTPPPPPTPTVPEPRVPAPPTPPPPVTVKVQPRKQSPALPPVPPKNQVEAVKVVKQFDAKLDAVHPSIKGEKRELAPPPPVIIDAELPATKKDVGPMVTFKEKKVEIPPATKKRLKRRSDVVVKVKKREPAPPKKKEIFPDITNEAAAASTVRDLEKSGKMAPKSLENSKINEVQRNLSLTFPSSELDKRFRVVLGARFSGVRSADAFRKALEQPINKGGLALEERAVNRVVDEVEMMIFGEHDNAAAKHASGKEAMVRKRQEKYGLRSGGGSSAKSSSESLPESTKNVQKQSGAKTVLSDSSMAPRVTPSGKRLVTDVRYKKRLVGPIEEFRRMNLDDFRRLPGDVSMVQENLLEDINVLGAGDPGLRIRAIEAWRESPLVLLYQRLIGAALQEGVPIETILQDKNKNPKGMTKDELDTVRKLNSKLRY